MTTAPDTWPDGVLTRLVRSIFIPFWRRFARATAVLSFCMPIAFGACLHQRLRNAREVSPAPAPVESLSLPPLLISGLARGAADKANSATYSNVSGDMAVSSDDSKNREEPVGSSASSTWSVPTCSTASAPQPQLPGVFEQLPVAGHPDAWLSIPTGATSPRPVVIVIHGAGDRPERQCRAWRHATSEYPFVVCPTGNIAPRFTHLGGEPLLKYIDDALDALAARYPEYADTRNPVLAGFSLGAGQVTELAVQFPARFPRIALVEGGTTAWSSARASAFMEGGGQRVLFGCGQEGVRNGAERAAKHLAGLGVDARVTFANVGHRFGMSLQDAVHDELAWLTETDERWSEIP
jgi:pimeloyl-ACP methyl ester carboxylesterase